MGKSLGASAYRYAVFYSFKVMVSQTIPGNLPLSQ